jgi:NAD(P)-dependent dehydrogenase (short-subunit alcohol dehydrogenase family)
LSDLAGRTALVTGAAQGIGAAIAERLRDSGAAVAAGDLAAPKLNRVLGVELDVSSETSVDEAFLTIEERLGPVAILVLNAGVFTLEPFIDVTLESWRRTISVNLDGAFLCARRALPAMSARGWGRIVGIGSSAGKTGGTKSVAAYAASKAGLMAMTKSIANEYASYGITSNALAPALIDTQMVVGLRDLESTIPVGRLGRPSEVAALVGFLCSNDAAFITGEVVDINGGFFID